MAVAVSADDVAVIVQYIAPGFFARVAFEARFPRREPSALNVLVWSIAASLPLVAIGNALASALGIERSATEWEYVATLLVPAVAAGYVAAVLRGSRRFRAALGRLGLPHQPEGSLYAQTMLGLRSDSVVTVEFMDGRKLSGTPRAGPSLAEDDVNEIVLTHPAWLIDGVWQGEGAGEAVLVPLDQMRTVTFEDDPFA